ncbi:MAG: S41 family peptidase [Chthoniobacterales bacterium]|nr:S41 family peptidase [Chthoniobacterales bacterium]
MKGCGNRGGGVRAGGEGTRKGIWNWEESWALKVKRKGVLFGVGLLVVCFVCCFEVVGMVYGQEEGNRDLERDEIVESLKLLANSMELIRQDYVEEERTSYKRLVHSALRGMLSELDPHSQFLDEESFRSLQEEAKGEYGGVGIQVGMKDGVLVVVVPIEGMPAFEAGLMPGDRILKIDGKTTERMSLPEAVDLLRGEVGQKVKLTIQRQVSGEVVEVTLQRVLIKTPSIREVRLMPLSLTGGKRIGYVRLVQFSENTGKELNDALDRLEGEGMEGLVLDLRYNPGGLLSSAVEVCGQFLPAATEVVVTAGRGENQSYVTGNSSRGRKFPLVVLINNASASGSEIVAGALKDLSRALVVGETSFGKGSVQSVSSMGDGTALRLTTAYYMTPSRQIIHERGVKPHVIAPMDVEREKELLRLRAQGRMGEKAEEWKRVYSIDEQLSRATQILRGLLIFKERHNSVGTMQGKGIEEEGKGVELGAERSG